MSCQIGWYMCICNTVFTVKKMYYLKCQESFLFSEILWPISSDFISKAIIIILSYGWLMFHNYILTTYISLITHSSVCGISCDFKPLVYCAYIGASTNMAGNGRQGLKNISFDSLAPGRCTSNFIISQHILRIKFMSTSCEIALWQMPQNTCDNKSPLVQVMAWCCQATSHCRSQCWPRSMSFGITRPQATRS